MIISVPDSEIVKLLEEEIMEEERMSISPLVTRKGAEFVAILLSRATSKRVLTQMFIRFQFFTFIIHAFTHIWNLWPTNPSLDINQNN